MAPAIALPIALASASAIATVAVWAARVIEPSASSDRKVSARVVMSTTLMAMIAPTATLSPTAFASPVVEVEPSCFARTVIDPVTVQVSSDEPMRAIVVCCTIVMPTAGLTAVEEPADPAFTIVMTVSAEIASTVTSWPPVMDAPSSISARVTLSSTGLMATEAPTPVLPLLRERRIRLRDRGVGAQVLGPEDDVAGAGGDDRARRDDRLGLRGDDVEGERAGDADVGGAGARLARGGGGVDAVAVDVGHRGRGGEAVRVDDGVLAEAGAVHEVEDADRDRGADAGARGVHGGSVGGRDGVGVLRGPQHERAARGDGAAGGELGDRGDVGDRQGDRGGDRHLAVGALRARVAGAVAHALAAVGG